MRREAIFKLSSMVLLGSWVLLALTPYLLLGIISLSKQSETGIVWGSVSPSSYFALISNPYFKILWHSTVLASECTLLCLLIAYPFSYCLSQVQYRYKNLLVLLVVIPFWTNSLVRTYAIVTTLKKKGLLNILLIASGAIEQPWQLLYTHTAVVIGLVYNLLPFMILPLYAHFDQLDKRAIEAARDLGAHQWNIFSRVILPLTLPGAIRGSLLVFLPAMSTFYIPDILGGAKSLLLGNLIHNQFLRANNWPLGASLSIFLTAVVTFLMWLYKKLDRQNSFSQTLI